MGFVAVDEAHHIAAAPAGERSAYLDLPEVLAALGRPTVLAVTATADAACAHRITETLGTARAIVDDADRPNLDLEDDRNLPSRENRLVSIVATGEKCVVYVNSREQTVALARTLRQRVPELGGAIAFYNGGLARADRTRVEEAFRAGDLTCIVSTSAFGEGVNLPDIRHVVLYHMPFSATAFNQMSGRAGATGRPPGSTSCTRRATPASTSTCSRRPPPSAASSSSSTARSRPCGGAIAAGRARGPSARERPRHRRACAAPSTRASRWTSVPSRAASASSRSSASPA